VVQLRSVLPGEGPKGEPNEYVRLSRIAAPLGPRAHFFAWLCRNRRLAKGFEIRVEDARDNLQLAIINRLTGRLAIL
jgi:hypothetical protein